MKIELEDKEIQSIGFSEAGPEIYVTKKEGYRVRIAKIPNNKYWRFSRFCFLEGKDKSVEIISNLEELLASLNTINLNYKLSTSL